MSPIVGIVVPCKDELEQVPVTARVLSELICSLAGSGMIDTGSFVLFVDDGSEDGTWGAICEAASSLEHVRGVRLDTCHGQSTALMTGMYYAFDDVDCIVTMDCDLQDDETRIGDMLSKFCAGCDCVSGVRVDRSSDTLFKRVSARSFYVLVRAFHPDTVFDSSEFRLYSSELAARMCYVWHEGYVPRILVTKFFENSDSVFYDRRCREHGTSKYDLLRMVRLALDCVRMPRRQYLLSGFDFESLLVDFA